MNRNVAKLFLIKLLILMIPVSFMMSCSSGSQGDSKEEDKTVSKKEEKPSSGMSEDGVMKLVINSNDQMQYDKKVLKVKAGSKVELTLNHTGQLPVETMGHNLVILKQGTNITEFGAKAMLAKETNYIPEGDEVLLHTELIGGGQSTTLSFDAPAKGTYDFICSFPGHLALMQGKFIVE